MLASVGNVMLAAMSETADLLDEMNVKDTEDVEIDIEEETDDVNIPVSDDNIPEETGSPDIQVKMQKVRFYILTLHTTLYFPAFLRLKHVRMQIAQFGAQMWSSSTIKAIDLSV